MDDVLLYPWRVATNPSQHHQSLATWPQSVIFQRALPLPDPHHGTSIDCSVTCNILSNYPHGSALNSYNIVHPIFHNWHSFCQIVTELNNSLFLNITDYYFPSLYWKCFRRWYSKLICLHKPKFAVPSYQRQTDRKLAQSAALLHVDVWNGNGRIHVRPGLGRDGGIERGVVWTYWGCHGNPAAKSRQGQCGREAVCSRSEGMPPRGQLVNCTNGTQALSAQVLAACQSACLKS